MAPLLSICIPTYKQPEALDRLLKDVLDQASPGLEVIVCDDSPDDVCEAIVGRYAKSATIPVIYFKGEKRGFDVAILFLVSKASGRYIWWLGDDRLAPNAINKVLGRLREFPDISFMYLNSTNTKDGVGVLKLGPDRFFKNKNEVLEEVSDLLAFISAIIIERDKALAALPEAKKYVGTVLTNLYIVLHVLSNSNRHYFINQPLIIAPPKHPDRPNFYDGFQVFGINYPLMLKRFSHAFGKSIRKTKTKNFKAILKGVLVLRAKGYAWGPKSKKQFIDFKSAYGDLTLFWLTFPLLFLPSSFLKIMYKVYLRIF